MSTDNILNLSEANLFTRIECENILNQLQPNGGAKFQLKDFRIEPEINTIGYLGQYFHLILNFTVADNNDSVVRHQRFFVKTLPYKNPELCRYVIEAGILKKEIALYSTLLKELKKFSPTALWADCLYTRDDLFVMQNLNDLDYQPSNNKSKTLSSNEMKSLLYGLAQMHASSIKYEIQNEQNIEERFKHALREITIKPQESYFTTGVRAIVAVTQQHPSYQSATHQKYIKEKLEADLHKVYDMVNPSEKYQNVFCHRDPWGGNIFFKNQREISSDLVAPVMFVDFQTCRYCPAAIDVIFALFMNLNIQDCKDLELIYLKWYYECLTEVASELNIAANAYISWQEFLRSYREFELFGLLYRAIAGTILHVPDGYLCNLKQNNPELYYKYAYVDRIAEVFNLMNDSNEFRDYMQQCVGDIMNLLYATSDEI